MSDAKLHVVCEKCQEELFVKMGPSFALVTHGIKDFAFLHVVSCHCGHTAVVTFKREE